VSQGVVFAGVGFDDAKGGCTALRALMIHGW
jgi:hypothetical protein